MAPTSRRPASKQSGAVQSAKELGFAVGVVVLILASITVYSGVWPPMVVVESGSMMHDDLNSQLGVIDTGDLTLVKKMGNDADIITYMQGKANGYKTYGAFGDVIIYAKNGFFGVTPIIHRAITRMVFNETTNSSFDFPELTPPVYDVSGGSVPLGPVWTWDRGHPGGAQVNMALDVSAIITRMGAPLHGGIITKGDHNDGFDQERLTVGVVGHNDPVQPVEHEWIVGVARGELPWFGAIKLFFGKNSEAIPPNSETNLFLALAAIIIVPFAVEWSWDRYGDRVKSKVPPKWVAAYHKFFDRFPGGKTRKAQREEEAAQRERDQRRRRRGRNRDEEE